VIVTDAFSRDLTLLRDHVHFRDPGLVRLVEIIGPQVAERLPPAPRPGHLGG
jgi:hypothetical protein